MHETISMMVRFNEIYVEASQSYVQTLAVHALANN